MRKGIMSLETISFQDNSFFKDLTDCVKEIRFLSKGLEDKQLENSKQVKDLLKCVKDRTGLSLTLKLHWVTTAITIPEINQNHVLFEFDSEQDIEALLNKENSFQAKGSVDINKAKVTGDYTKLDHFLFINKNFLLEQKTYTDQEVAAVILHELGHAFTSLEYLNRNIKTNQSLSLLSKALEQNLPLEKREDIFVRINNLKNVDSFNKKKILESKSKQELSILVIGQEIEKCKSELGISLYDFNSSEYLADMFATRFGAGKDLVTALDKINSDNIFYGNILNTILTMPFCFLTILGLFMGLPASVPFITIASIGVTITACQTNQKLNDDPVSRFRRIKQDNIERLKNQKLKDSEKQDILNQNKSIDLVMDTVRDNKSFFETIAYWTRPGYRKEKDFELLQKQLESLASNTLFEKTTTLSLIK